jgi:hypothetical protein
VLNVSGTAALDGAFVLIGLDGYNPCFGTSFAVVNYGSRVGMFASLSLPSISTGQWDPRYDDPNYPNALSLWVLI